MEAESRSRQVAHQMRPCLLCFGSSTLTHPLAALLGEQDPDQSRAPTSAVGSAKQIHRASCWNSTCPVAQGPYRRTLLQPATRRCPPSSRQEEPKWRSTHLQGKAAPHSLNSGPSVEGTAIEWGRGQGQQNPGKKPCSLYK